MRRGTLNKTSFILIFFVALSTILSFGFDQMVIRTEDKIRNLNIEYQNINNSLSKHETISETLDSISMGGGLNFTPIILRRNLLIKSYILNEVDTYNFLNRKSNKINAQDLGRMMMKEIMELTVMMIEIRSQYEQLYIINEKIFNKIGKDKYHSVSDLFEFDMNPFKKDKEKFYNKNILLYTKLLGFNYHWKDKSYSELQKYREKAIKEFRVREWYDVYKYKMLLFKKIENDMKIMDELSDLFVLKSDELYKKLNEKISELKSSNIKKNFYILTSIFFQIVSLLFLLLLFRSFIIKVG